MLGREKVRKDDLLKVNFVSLKGPRGERGADGFPGKAGPKVLERKSNPETHIK